jgi:two-component system, OmpR family, response regulator
MIPGRCARKLQALRDEGFGVSVAHDGVKGYALVRESTFDVVLLDLKLPGMDGFEVLRKIREKDDDVKVIIVTARPIVSDLMTTTDGSLSEGDYEALELADGIVNKPYDMATLLDIIKESVK